jgi:hypothetical protein
VPETVKLYGASDDNVEVEGNVPGCDEYGSYDNPKWIEFSTGDVFKVEYTDAGVWKVEHITQSGKVVTVKRPHGEGEDPEPYTETMTVVGPIQWVEAWDSWPIELDEITSKIKNDFDCTSHNLPDFFNDDDLRSLWNLIATAKRRKK